MYILLIYGVERKDGNNDNIIITLLANGEREREK